MAKVKLMKPFRLPKEPKMPTPKKAPKFKVTKVKLPKFAKMKVTVKMPKLSDFVRKKKV